MAGCKNRFRPTEEMQKLMLSREKEVAETGADAVDRRTALVVEGRGRLV